AIVDPAGVLLPDQRQARFDPREWAVDPLRAAGLGVDASRRSPLVAQRYLLGGAVHRSPRGSVFIAADLIDGWRRILKQASADALLTSDGRDARDRLRHEAHVLRAVGGDPFPCVYDLVEDDEDLYLVLEDLVG